MLDLLAKRRSIRKYKDQQIEVEKIEALVKSALLSPSSRSINPWEFIVVTDKDVLEKLSQCKEHSASFLKWAPLGIVVLADGDKTDVWVEDTSIASIIIQLEAEALGLGSCWIQIRNRLHDSNKTAEDYVKDLLDIPANYKVESIISIGYPDQTKPAYEEDYLAYDKIHQNSFGKKYK